MKYDEERRVWIINPQGEEWGGAPEQLAHGGPGSGHFGHEGRPGERGGSAPGGGNEPTRSPRTPKGSKESPKKSGDYNAPDPSAKRPERVPDTYKVVTSFKPAATMEEATKVMQGHLKENGDIHLEGINLDQMNHVNQGMSILNDFNVQVDHVRWIDTGLPEDTGLDESNAAYNRKTNTIKIQKSFMETYQTTLPKARDAFEASRADQIKRLTEGEAHLDPKEPGYSDMQSRYEQSLAIVKNIPRGNAAYEIDKGDPLAIDLTHEAWHAIYWKAGYHDNFERAVMENMATPADFKTGVSYYAGTDIHEAFAETATAVTYHEKISPKAQKIFDETMDVSRPPKPSEDILGDLLRAAGAAGVKVERL